MWLTLKNSNIYISRNFKWRFTPDLRACCIKRYYIILTWSCIFFQHDSSNVLIRNTLNNINSDNYKLLIWYYSYLHHFSRYLKLHANWIKKNLMSPTIVSLMINMSLRKLTILSYLKKKPKAITSSVSIVLIYILKAGCETYWRWGS